MATSSKIGYGLEETVLDLVRKFPKWEPARQNGKAVAWLHRQPITVMTGKNKGV